MLKTLNGIARLLTSGSLKYRARDKPWFTLGHGIILIYTGLGLLASMVYYFTLRMENGRRDRGARDEIIDGVNDSGMLISHYTMARHRLIYPCDIGDPEIVERLIGLNGRFETVEDAKREKGDNWSGYRYTL